MSDATEREQALQSYVGKVLVPRSQGQDPVNVPMIRHWVEAMGDPNPVYLSNEAAQASGRPGLVAPASMAQTWTMRGYAAGTSAGGSARTGFDELVELLAQEGCTSVVATDSEFEFHRELVPGDLVSTEEVVESISPEKRTGLGTGRFVTTVRTYTDADGRVVATQRWRTLRFRPAEKRALRPRPAINQDNEFWFEAARRERLVIQRCRGCEALRHPPGPCCPQCQSFDWDAVEASGRATVHSFVVAHPPPHPAFDYPLLIAVVDLSEGTRLITNLVGVAPDEVVIGMPVRLEWLEADPQLVLPVFRPES